MTMDPPHFFLILVALQLADIYTTLRALKLGGREANPIIERLTHHIQRIREDQHGRLVDTQQ